MFPALPQPTLPQYSPTALGVSDEQCHGSLARVVSGQLLYGDQHPRVDTWSE